MFFNAACYNTVSSGYLWLRRRQFVLFVKGNASKEKTNPFVYAATLDEEAPKVVGTLRNFYLHGLRN